MQAHIRALRQRVRDSRYAIDEDAVARAVLARTRPRRNAERARAREHLARLAQQIKRFRVDDQDVPARSVRRATARRASTRRAVARSRQHDPAAQVIGFLTTHPQSTAGDLARSLNLDPENVSTLLSQLASTGEIKKHAHGYSTQRPARPRR